MCLLKIKFIELTIFLNIVASTNKCRRFFDQENYNWWSSDKEFYKKFASQYADSEVERYKDGLLYMNGYPVHENIGNYYECLSPDHLLGRFIWDLQEDQADVAPCVPSYRTRMLMLSPSSTLPLDSADRLAGTTVVRSTLVKETLWKYERDNSKTFSEIFYIDNHLPIACSDVSNYRHFQVLDGKYIAENVFTDYLANKPKIFKFFLIVVLINATDCLKIRVHYTKDLWNGTHDDVCYHCPRMYHSSYDVLYNSYDRIEHAESSPPPWVDEELRGRSSTWCRSHRLIMAVTDIHWFIESESGKTKFTEQGIITGPTYCSLLVDGNNRDIMMHFDEFRYLLTVKIKLVSRCKWKIDALGIKYRTRKKEGTLHVSKGPNRVVRFKETMYWQNSSNELIIARGCGPHLRIGIIAVEFNDNGVGYNFSNKLF